MADLVWNPATGTFDVSGSSSMNGQMDVMVSTTKEGHFAANQADDLVFDPDTGEFVSQTPERSPVTPAATAIQEAVPVNGQMEVMKSVVKDGHFADMGRLKQEFKVLNAWFGNNKKRLTSTSASMLYKNKYTVTIEFGDSYPNEMPRCFLANTDLRFKDGGLVTEKGASHEYHLLGTQGGRAQICHGRPSAWRPNMSLASVFIKAFMWLEAYENHLKTGNNLESYLKTQAQ